MSVETNRTVRVGRWILIATQVWACVWLSLCGILASYMVATGSPRLRFYEPWGSILFYALFVPSIAVVLCWSAFCLVFAAFLRRRGKAGSLNQVAAIAFVLVPFLGLRYYDCTMRGLMDPDAVRH